MSNTFSEKQVLKKLHIPDFRHLSKKNVIKFVSMMDKMDTEVAKKALEQFPDFANTIKGVLSDCKDTMDKGIESNNKSMQYVYDSYNSVIVSLQKELNKDNLSFEEKKFYLEKMEEIADKVREADKDNKKFIIAVSAIAGAIAITVGGLLFGGLGGQTTIESTDDLNDDLNDDRYVI